MPAANKRGLYAALREEVRWDQYVRPEDTIAVFGARAGREPEGRDILPPRFASLVVKDAVVDDLRERLGQRPDVDIRSPTVPLKLVLRGMRASIYRDLVGDSLHKRGWRPIQHKSPLNEAMAAGLLRMSGWDADSPLVDPMCGSGTFLVEAAHLAGDRAPGLRRTFAFQGWKDFDQTLFRDLVEEAKERWEEGRREIPPLMGNDQHSGALSIARRSMRTAEVQDCIRLEHGDADAYEPATNPSVVVCNPPYGERLTEDLEHSWHALGTFLRRCPGARAWLLSGNASLTRHLGLRSSDRLPVKNGPIDCRWMLYEMRAS